MRIGAKIGRSMGWMAALVTTLVTIGPGALSFAGTEEGLEPAVNVSSELSEPPSDVAVRNETLPAVRLADEVQGREPGGPAGLPSAAAPDREVAEETPRAPKEPAASPEAESAASEDYDPWEPFNERMFTFNRELDHYVLKPVATGWDTVVPNPVQRGLGRMFDNAGMPRRFVNNLLQGKVEGAGRELGRLLLNSTIGLAGFFDVAREIGLEPSDKDTGQTLGVWGVGPGPYLVLPFMPPMTVRDGIGSGIDVLLNPVTYFAPFAALLGIKGADTMNSRSLNLEVFEHVEEGTIDMYSAVRNAYLQRRENAVRENRE